MSVKIPPKGTTIKGLDVSHYKPALDWDMVYQKGYRFSFCKATEGETYKDNTFVSHTKEAHKANLFVGAYHFARTKYDPLKQAQNFIDAIKNVEQVMGYSLELPPVLDIEWNDNKRGMDLTQESIFLKILDKLEETFNRVPMIYTASGYFSSTPNPSKFAKYFLWVANYGTSAPSVPAPWNDWQIWQYTDNEIIPGYGHGLDANYWNGDAHSLVNFCSGIIPRPTTPGIDLSKDNVKGLQSAINNTGYKPALTVDGIKGPKTNQALIDLSKI